MRTKEYNAELSRKWRKNNQTKYNEYCKKHYLKNRDKILSRRKERRKEAPHLSKNDHLKYAYGIDLNEYSKLLQTQNGLCAICKKFEVLRDKRTGNIRNLSVDHSHSTGKVRGLLCASCNTGIGKLKDNVSILEAAISYLKKDN